VHTTGQVTNTRCSDVSPDLDGTLREVTRKKILHYHQLYNNRPAAKTSVLVNDIPEESDQFRCLRLVILVFYTTAVFPSVETPSSTFNPLIVLV
jgi:hypothetical protein